MPDHTGKNECAFPGRRKNTCSDAVNFRINKGGNKKAAMESGFPQRLNNGL
jgi:hypothetical protein